MLRPDAILRRCSDVRFRTVLDEGVVLKQATAEILVVNEVGARALELLDGQRALADVHSTLAGEFEATSDDISRDLDVYLAELLEIGVIEEIG